MLSNETIGYSASIFVVISLLMSDMKKLRYVNLVGCTLFVVYGLIGGLYPVVFMNAIAVLINIYYLIKLRQPAL